MDDPKVSLYVHIPPWGAGADNHKLSLAIAEGDEPEFTAEEEERMHGALLDYRKHKREGSVRLVSHCCGASPKYYGDCDSDSTDWGFCPECHDHCEFVPEEE